MNDVKIQYDRVAHTLAMMENRCHARFTEEGLREQNRIQNIIVHSKGKHTGEIVRTWIANQEAAAKAAGVLLAIMRHVQSASVQFESLDGKYSGEKVE